MRACSVFFVAWGFSILFPVISVMAADQTATENRMREVLRNTILQLRSCETETATLQAAKSQAEDENKRLNDQVASLTAKSNKTEKTLAEQAAELEEFKAAIKNWQTAYQQITDSAQKTEAERAKLTGQVIALQRQAEDQERRNAALFKIGNEILTRYEHFGLGDALGAKEPFVGITRVKLENLVQDYKDKLADQKIKP
jgi:chromosome segregation ATPase